MRPRVGAGAGILLALALLAPACGDTGSTATVAPRAEDLDVQGHRGARGLRPENTLPSFQAALDAGVTTLEMDLQFTGDGEVVVWHDPGADSSKCNVTGSITIGTAALADLQGVVCDRNPDPGRFPDQTAPEGDYTIATLGQVLDAFAGSGVQFNIETKRQPPDPVGPFERAVVEIVQARDLVDRVTVQSFDHRSLWAVRELEPGIALAALTRRGDVPDFADLAARGAAIWSPDYRTVSQGTLSAAHDAGLRVIPWTINDPADMRRLVDLGVDGLITDRPDLAAEL